MKETSFSEVIFKVQFSNSITWLHSQSALNKANSKQKMACESFESWRSPRRAFGQWIVKFSSMLTTLLFTTERLRLIEIAAQFKTFFPVVLKIIIIFQQEIEKFPLSLVHDPVSVVSEDKKDIYNNIVLFTVLEDSRKKNPSSPSEMHIFQCNKSHVR